MTPAFLTGLDRLKQMEALSGCCDTQPPVVVYRDRPGQSQPAAAVPDGWVLVPRLPTLDMSVAFAEAFYSQRRAIDDDQIGDWWAAMLAAAPQVPQQAAERPTRGDLIAALRQAREALALPCDRWNATQSRIVREALATVDAVLRDAPPATPVA